MKNQTAVEWLMEQIVPTISIRLSDTYIKELKDQAKAMEKEQIEDAAGIGHFEGMGKAPMSSIEYFEYAVEFYKKHYGQ
jgi:hypothetical protein